MRNTGILSAMAASLSLSAAALAQTPAGVEFQVNTYTTGYQWISQAAAWRDGFIVVWKSGFASNDTYIAGQRYAPDGSPRGAEIVISGNAMNQFNPLLAADARGNFVVVWGKEATVVGRLFDASGAPRTGEFQVPVANTGQVVGSVAMGPRGDFVVVWTSNSHDGSDAAAVGRRFDPAGAPLGQEFVINAYTTGRQGVPWVSMDDAGRFVVAWTDLYQSFPVGPAAVKVRLFDATGNPLLGETRVNPPPGPITPPNPVVAMADAGEFVVTWADSNGGSPGPIFARRYDATGAPTTAPLQVNTAGVDFNPTPDVSMDGAGNFAVTWQESQDIAAVRRFDAAGTPRGAMVRANVSQWAYRPRIASDPSGNLLAVFEIPEAPPPAAFPRNLHARRFGGLLPAALAVDTAGNGVLEPGETVRVDPSWRNFSTAAQTFGGGLSAMTGPPGATYAITDATTSYGTVPDGTTQACVDCYGVLVSNPPSRPAVHWDASAIELITPDVLGQTQRWRLHIGDSFTDVPRANPFYRFVETLLHFDITGGCTSNTYCPTTATSREQMAVFVLVAGEGAGYAPPACVPPNLFADVPETSVYCRWIEELANRGVVAGCGSGNYCPTLEVAREQMAVFVLRTLDPALNPPACVPPNIYGDVPETSAFCPWIEELTNRNVVTGCGGGNYCPLAPVSREQMSVFIAATFGLSLYGP